MLHAKGNARAIIGQSRVVSWLAQHTFKSTIIIISIYSHSYLGVSSNLIGLLSWNGFSIIHSKGSIVRYPNETK